MNNEKIYRQIKILAFIYYFTKTVDTRYNNDLTNFVLNFLQLLIHLIYSGENLFLLLMLCWILLNWTSVFFTVCSNVNRFYCKGKNSCPEDGNKKVKAHEVAVTSRHAPIDMCKTSNRKPCLPCPPPHNRIGPVKVGYFLIPVNIHVFHSNKKKL